MRSEHNLGPAGYRLFSIYDGSGLWFDGEKGV